MTDKVYFQAYIASPDGYEHIQSEEIPIDEKELKIRGKETVFREILDDFRASFINNRVYGKFTKDGREVDHYPKTYTEKIGNREIKRPFPGVLESTRIKQVKTKTFNKQQYLFGVSEQGGRKRAKYYSIQIIKIKGKERRVYRDKYGRFTGKPK